MPSQAKASIFQWIFGGAGAAALTLIFHDITLISDQRDHAAKIEIDLWETGQVLKDPAGEQPAVRMVVYSFHAHAVLQPVKQLSRRALEPGILFTRASDSIDDIMALRIAVQEQIDHSDVILKVCIHENGNIRIRHGAHQPGQQRVLVSTVARQV